MVTVEIPWEPPLRGIVRTTGEPEGSETVTTRGDREDGVMGNTLGDEPLGTVDDFAKGIVTTKGEPFDGIAVTTMGIVPLEPGVTVEVTSPAPTGTVKTADEPDKVAAKTFSVPVPNV